MKYIILSIWLILDSIPNCFAEINVNSSVEERILLLEQELNALKEQTQQAPTSSFKANTNGGIKKTIDHKVSPNQTKDLSTNSNDANDQIVDAKSSIKSKKENKLSLDNVAVEFKDKAVESEKNPQEKIQTSLSTAAEKNSERERDLFDQAQMMLSQNKFEMAQQLFLELTKAYPHSDYFLKATYWLAELTYMKHDYIHASLLYGTLYQQYKLGTYKPDDKNRISEALIKFAECLKRLGKRQEACIILAEFDKEFSDVTYNRKKFAHETKISLQCSKH